MASTKRELKGCPTPAVPSCHRYRPLVSLAACLALLIVIALTCGCSSTPRLSARQILERAVDDLLGLETYVYSGTSSLKVNDDPRLDNKAEFRTVLVRNDRGGLDGHMVVESPDYSYETYGYDGSEYTKVEGGGWTRVTRGDGYGLVSTDARRIISEFADLVEDVKITSQTSDDYTVSLVMGDKYSSGAASIAGSVASTPSSAAGKGETSMTLVVGKDDLRFKSVRMVDRSPSDGSTPAFEIVTEGTYTRFDEPADIKPPPDALSAAEVSAQEAPPVNQY